VRRTTRGCGRPQALLVATTQGQRLADRVPLFLQPAERLDLAGAVPRGHRGVTEAVRDIVFDNRATAAGKRALLG
jgi:hypothetical protein